jgi:hypothetical protein
MSTYEGGSLRTWRAALHVTVRYMSQEGYATTKRYVSRRVTANGAAQVPGRAAHQMRHPEKNGWRATRSKYLVIPIW